MTAVLTAPTPVLPDLVVGRLADLIADDLAGHGVGHCVRVDNVRRDDAHALAAAVRARVPAGSTDVHVLAGQADDDRADAAPGSPAIPVERAVELRNRKQRRLVLLVPVGAGTAASSLDNSFARVDVATVLARAGTDLVDRVDDADLVRGLHAVARVLGRARPVEAWARYVAAVVASPTWATLGGALWRVGLVPDLGAASLLDRLARNADCVKAISRPVRAVASVPDRLAAAELRESAELDRLARYLGGPDVDLSDVASWAAPLSAAGELLSFDRWPLAEREPVAVERMRVDPFTKDDGTLRPGTRLTLDAPGDLPFATARPDGPAVVAVTWRTDPARADGVDRWRLEAVAPDDLRDPDAEPVARQTVKGDKRRATVRIDVDEDSAPAAALLVVRVTALDDAGQPVELLGGEEATAESQQFEVRWNGEPAAQTARRASTPSLAQARLEGALSGQDDHGEDAPGWSKDGGAFTLVLGGRRTVQLALSPVLVGLQRRALAARGQILAWETDARLGEPIDLDDVAPQIAPLPPALAERRRRLFGLLAARAPRDVVETLAWDDDLRQEARAYCQSYRRALDATTDPAVRDALLVLDTVRLSIDTAGNAPVAAAVVLPLHPMRLAWLAEYDATLTRWARELAGLGRGAARRRHAVDLRLVARISPANLPFALLGVIGEPYVHAREASLGTGIYFYPGDPEPGAAVQAAFDVLGLDRRDVAPELPPAVIAERIAAYRTAHPGEDTLRLIASNAGSGELLAGALRDAVLARPDGDDEAEAPSRLEITAYSSRRSLTDPVPALTDLQREVAAQPVRGTRSYLGPPLGLAVRPHERLTTDPAAAHLGVVADLAVVQAEGDADIRAVAVPDTAPSFRNLLTPATNQRVATDDGSVVWRTAPALRTRTRDGAADVVDAHRSYQLALAARLGHHDQTLALAARLGPPEAAALRAAHERADWVLTLDRNLGIDLYTPTPGVETPYILDYAPDFLEGLGPRLTVTTVHRGEVDRLLAGALRDLHLDAVDSSVRVVLDHLQVVSGRLALRLVARSSLATEAVSLAALMAHLRRRGELDGTVVVPVDAHHEMFGDPGSDAGMRRCDVILVRSTARTLRMECVEVKSRRAAVLPQTLVDDIVDQLDATVAMLRDTFFRVDPPRIDAELQRARLGGILRHHADRALAMSLLDERRRAEIERLVERMEDGSLTPEIGRRGYVVSLAGAEGFPARERGVKIDVLTAADLGQSGFRPSERPEPAGTAVAPSSPAPPPPAPLPPSPRPRPRPGPVAEADTAAPAPSTPTRDDPTGPIRSVPPAGPPPVGPPPGPGPRPAAPSPAGRAAPAVAEVLLGHDQHAEEVRWRISTQGSPHLFVLGIPGQGKSVTTRRILDSFADQGLPALVVDFHGDMAAAPAGGAAVLDAARGLPISPFELDDPAQYRHTAWQLAEVISYVCGLGKIQHDAVYASVCAVYERHGAPAGLTGVPTMAELAEAALDVEKAGRGRNVVARLRPLTDFGLFAPGARGFTDLLRQGVVVDVHPLMEQVQLAAGAFVLRKVYREMFGWGQTGRLRLAVVLDEAHRLARDVTLPKIMKEGRKYGVAVVVASQGVDDFHKDVLGNAGTKVAFRCNFPQSRTVAGFLRGRPGQDMAQALENLSVGQAYVSTPDHATARKVLMAR